LQRGKSKDRVLLTVRSRKIPLLSLGWFTLIPPEAERTVIEVWLSICKGIEINKNYYELMVKETQAT
jgi:hypothetical protein